LAAIVTCFTIHCRSAVSFQQENVKIITTAIPAESGTMLANGYQKGISCVKMYIHGWTCLPILSVQQAEKALMFAACMPDNLSG